MDTPEEKAKEAKATPEGASVWGLPRPVISFVVVAVASAAVYRMVTVQCDLQFDFPAFLALLLALFAVGLSALFYFKTTETSNAFYDNTHKFTREVSQILGRIEERFGERLRHLDEGYTGLRDKFESLPFNVSEAREEAKEGEEEVAKKEAEVRQMLDDLAEKAKLAEDEKSVLFEKLERAQQEAVMSRRELGRLQSRIRHAEESRDLDPDVDPGLARYLLTLLRKHTDPRSRRARHPSNIKRLFEQSVLPQMDQSTISYMQSFGLVDEGGHLTIKGTCLVRDLLSQGQDEG